MVFRWKDFCKGLALPLACAGLVGYLAGNMNEKSTSGNEKNPNASIKNKVAIVGKPIIVDRPKEDIYDLENRVEEDNQNTDRYTISNTGLEMIKGFEGFREEAYRCPAGVWTIGYGTTGDVSQGDTITKSEAEARLRKDLESRERVVREYVDVNLSQQQYDALVSFVYNVGEEAFRNSTLLRKLNKGDYEGASQEFGRWVYANGQKLEGLERRRDIEARLFEDSYGGG
ncbi:MAG: lysozyme [Candidatus Nanoarchaeia archaeon]